MELAREPLNMRSNPLNTHVTLSICAWAALPTCESAGPRACQGPTREVSGPGAHERARVCGERTSSEQFRMQFDWVNFQQFLQTLQFQRCGCVVRYGARGIACETLDRPPGDGLAVLLGIISVTTGVLADVPVGCRTPGCLVSASDEPANLAHDRAATCATAAASHDSRI